MRAAVVVYTYVYGTVLYNGCMDKGKELTISTKQNRQVVDITGEVQAAIGGGNPAGACVVFVAHTTCAVTTADLDPGADQDLLDAVWGMIPRRKYRHPHDPKHVPAHLASSVIGPSVTVPVASGKLVLGTWQRIVLVELDGPRERRVVVTVL